MSDFYNKYPYTDFHELNLDWVIERVKKLTEDWADTLEEWNSTEEQWQELYDYVHDYFDNLDVQQEINNKINAMIADGTFQQIATPIIQAKVAADLPGVVSNQIGGAVSAQIGSTVAGQLPGVVSDQIGTAVVNPVNTWLANNITQPTTPVVDTSLSIATAAADAAVTGGNIARLNDNIKMIDDQICTHLMEPFTYASGATYQTPFLGYFMTEPYQEMIRGKHITAIRANFSDAGTFSIVKAKDVGTTGTTNTVLTTVTVTETGWQDIAVDVTLADDEWLGIGNGGDTAKIVISNSAPADYRVWYVNASNVWNYAAVSLNIYIFGDYIAELHNTDVAIQNEINDISDSMRVPLIEPFTDQTGGTYTTPYIGYFMTEPYQAKIRNTRLSSIHANFSQAGTFTIVKAKDVGTTGTTNTIIKQFVITETGEQDLYFSAILADDEWLGIGNGGDTAKIVISNVDVPIDYRVWYINNQNEWQRADVSLNITIYGDGIQLMYNELATIYKPKYYHKAMCAIGDSITNGFNTTKTYAEFLADLLECDYSNFGVNGSTIADGSNPMWSRAASISGAYDLIFVFGGTNDYALQNRLLGDMYQAGTEHVPNDDTTTFYGGINKLLNTLLTKYPRADIYLLTPLHRGIFYGQTDRTDQLPNSNGLYLSQYVEALKISAAHYSIPVIDLYAISGMNPNVSASANAYFNHTSSGIADHLHPDVNGHKRLAQVIYSKICDDINV